MKDLRQSQEWAGFLKSLGWISEKISNNFIYIKVLPFGSLIKIQRAQSLTAQFLSGVDEIAKKYHALFVKIEPAIILSDAKAEEALKILKEWGYIKNNFPLTSPATVRIDLTQSTDKLWHELSKDAKYAVKRAEKEAVIIEKHKNPQRDVIGLCQKIIEQAGKERKYHYPSLGEFIKRMSAFGDRAILYFAKIDDQIISINEVLTTNKSGFYTQSATTKIGRRTYSNYFLLWKIIEDLAQNGLDCLDLDGVNDERFPKYTDAWAGFSYFKRKFGGEEIKFLPPFLKYYNPTLEKMGKLLGQLPL
ncbi:MAG: peptidoglycan bridge formation glycyltransferase FemA/FemB family protein [Patescibacteria group bacterium]